MNQDYIFSGVADKTLNKFSYRPYPLRSTCQIPNKITRTEKRIIRIKCRIKRIKGTKTKIRCCSI